MTRKKIITNGKMSECVDKFSQPADHDKSQHDSPEVSL